MDLLLEKQYSKPEIEKVIHILQFQNNKIELVGTAGLKRQFYPADFDFLTKIKFLKTKNMYEEFKRILEDIQKEPNLYFIEFKFQNKDDSKNKIFKIEDFTKKNFYKYFKTKNIKYCKIDLIINVDYQNDFKEVSIIYFLTKKNDKDITKEEYIQDLEDDFKELKQEGKYYKSLKRLFIISKLNDDYKRLTKLTLFFNSNFGKLYLLKNKLEAIEILLTTFKNTVKEDDIKKRIEYFLIQNKLKNLKIENIPNLIKDYNLILNKEGLKILKQLK
jgi:hypothetical protein